MQKSNRLLSKYQIESKLDYINQAHRESVDQTSKSEIKLPRYMAPTIGEIKKRQITDEPADFVPIESQLRKETTPKASMLFSAGKLKNYGSSTSLIPKKQAWKPTQSKD